MNKPVFYIDTDTMNLLLHSGLERPKEEFDLVAEFTDIPYWATVRFLKTRIIVTVFRRLELHSPNEKYAERLAKATDYRKGKVDVNAAPGIGENIGPIYWTCLLLCSLMDGRQPEGMPEDGGILVENKDGKWLKTPVRGKQRPDLMVTTLFHGNMMARPYLEDAFERDVQENMDVNTLMPRGDR